MDNVTTTDGVDIFYKDWGPKDAQPLVFHHGWPLSADDWDAQLLYFLGKGYRVIAQHDGRGHGRSSQVSAGRALRVKLMHSHSLEPQQQLFLKIEPCYVTTDLLWQPAL